MTIQIEPLPPEEPQKKQHGCLLRAVAGIVILALLASSLVSVAWFVRRQAQTQSQADVPAQAQLPPKKVEVPGIIVTEPTPQLEATSEPTAPETKNSRIVLVNEDGQVETTAPDGSQRRILSSDEYTFQFPAWSPDGAQIAVLGSNTEGSGIFLLQDQEDPAAMQQILFESGRNPFYVYWSPDSSKISFLSSQFGSAMSLNVVEAQEDMESRQIATGSPFFWNWTADSQQLLIHSGALSDEERLALIDEEDSDQASEISSPGYFQAPGISPSGRYWAYSQLQADGNSWLTVDDRQSGDTQSERHAGSVALSWSPVDDRLAFISGEDNRQASYWGPLRLIDATTGEMRVLSSNLVLAFFWSPDGKQIATISVRSSNGFNDTIEVRAPKSGNLGKIVPATLPALQLQPHQFAISVIDVDSGAGLELGEVGFTPSFLTQFLIFFDQYALSHHIWSPNSDALVMPLLNDNESQITVISTKSGRQNKIGVGQIAFWSP